MHHLIAPLALGALLCLGAPAARAAEEQTHYDRINLSATASEEVENDLLVAVLFEQREGQDPSALADQVNRAVAAALERAKAIPGVRVQTLDYRSTPVYRQELLSAWRVRQSIRLESRDAARLSRLIGDLQAALQVESIAYRVSDERRGQAEERLVKETLAGFNRRAGLVAAELGRPGYRLVRLDIATQGTPIQPVALGMMAMEAAAPALEPGTQQLSVTVAGTVELKPGE